MTVDEREARIAAAEAPIRARAEATRREASRWYWVMERWHNDPTPVFMRGTSEPTRYTIDAPDKMFLAQVRALSQLTIPTAYVGR